MRCRVFVLLALMIALAGCQGRPVPPMAKDPLPVSAPAPQPEPAPEPAPVPVPEPPLPPPPADPPADPPAPPAENPLLTAVCNHDLPASERLEALKTAALDYAEGRISSLNRENEDIIPCIRGDEDKEHGILVVNGPWGKGGGTLVIAWREQDRWRVAGAAEELFLDWVWVAHGGLKDGRPDLVLVNGNYSGHAKVLLHVSVDASGQLEIVRGPGFGKSSVEPLPGDLILVNARTHEWYELFPEACEACMPVADQVLTRWDGTGFVVDATRMVPDPIITLNRLRTALQRADRATALTLVSAPALLDQIGPFLPPSENYERYANAGQIYKLESRNWAALPAALQTTLPESMRTFAVPLEAQGTSATVHLTRTAAEWVVTRLELTGPPLRPVGLAEVTPALQAILAAPGPQEAYRAADPAAVQLQSFLHTLEGWRITELPGVSFFLAPGDGARLVMLNSAPKGYVAWTWVQWWDEGRPRLQALHIRSWDEVQSAGLLEANGQKHLSVLWKDAGHDKAVVYRLDANAGRWVEVEDAFALIPVKIGGNSLTSRSPELFSHDKGFAIRLKDGGRSLELCGTDGSCLVADWSDGRYLPR